MRMYQHSTSLYLHMFCDGDCWMHATGAFDAKANKEVTAAVLANNPMKCATCCDTSCTEYCLVAYVNQRIVLLLSGLPLPPLNAPLLMVLLLTTCSCVPILQDYSCLPKADIFSLGLVVFVVVRLCVCACVRVCVHV